MKQERFGELDALRGVAALAVVFYHYSFHYFPWRFELGKYGVQLFFCVSGFVIFWTLHRSQTLADFAFSRFSRLYPAYWAAVLLSPLVSHYVRGEPVWLLGYAANATMLQKFFGVPDVDVVYWTLAVELVFYVWMAMLFATKQLDRMPVVAAGWLGLSGVAAIAQRFVKLPAAIDTYFILSSIPYFLAGVMFYLISKEGWKRAYVAVIGCAMLVVGLRGWEGLAVAAIVFVVFASAIAGRLRWVVNPVTAWLGAISYTLYLTHRNMGYVVMWAIDYKQWPVWAVLVMRVAFALLVASAITYLVERPAMSVLRAWYKRRKPKSARVPAIQEPTS